LCGLLDVLFSAKSISAFIFANHGQVLAQFGSKQTCHSSGGGMCDVEQGNSRYFKFRVRFVGASSLFTCVSKAFQTILQLTITFSTSSEIIMV